MSGTRTVMVCIGMFVAMTVQGAGVASVSYVPPGLNVGDTYHLVFLTSGKRNATSVNISKYNDFVQSESERLGALTEGWGIDWFAIGSTAIEPFEGGPVQDPLTIDARDNALITAPVYLLSGDLVATGYADMWDGRIETPINVDQYGISSPLATEVWTGSISSGIARPCFSCPKGRDDYLGPNFSVLLGSSNEINSHWIGGGFGFENELKSMYALSEPLTVVPEPTSLSFLGISAFGIAVRRRRRQPA